jgi:3-phenylpropionate/trans-cinnamate dioxygenase ferredoxin reductase subunit
VSAASSGLGEPLDPDASVTVVGASLAGLRAAQALRRGGHRGRLVLVGAEDHLPYDRPPLSKQVLAGKWEPEKTGLADAPTLDALGIEARLGHRATALDAEARRVDLDDGSDLQADAVVVATGATPRHIFAAEGALVLRTLDDCRTLRAAVLAGGERCRVVVIGAGFIGSEVAATCASLGCAVTVIETLPVPLAPALGETIGGALGALHARHGVTLRTQTSISALRPGADSTSAELTDGSSIEADVVVAGIGVVPEVTWLEGSGLTLENGVVCDDALFAADGVVAAGDIARWPFRGAHVRIEHWQMAADMGEAAAGALLAGRAAAPAFVPVPYFWSDQYGEKIQMLGRPGPDDEVVVVDGDLGQRFVALYRRGDSLSAVVALTRPRQLMSFRPLLVAGASFDEGLAAAQSLH